MLLVYCEILFNQPKVSHTFSCKKCAPPDFLSVGNAKNTQAEIIHNANYK